MVKISLQLWYYWMCKVIVVTIIFGGSWFVERNKKEIEAADKIVYMAVDSDG